MGLLEVSFLLLGATSVGQYLYGWAVYAEKQLVLVSLEIYSRPQEPVCEILTVVVYTCGITLLLYIYIYITLLIVN